MKFQLLLSVVWLGSASAAVDVSPAQDDPLLAALAGEFALLEEKPAAAARAYALAARHAARADYAERAARLALYAKDAATAAEMARLWHALDPADTSASQAAALAHVGQHDPDGAFAVLVGLAERGPQGMEAVVQALAAMPPEHGLPLLRRMLDAPQWRNLPPGERSPVALAVRWKDLDLARTLADAGVQTHPHNARAWLWRAVVQAANEDRAGAALSYARALELDPGNVNLRLSYVQLLNELQRVDEIEAVLKAAPSSDYRLYAARMALAVMQQQPRQYGRLARSVQRDRSLSDDDRAFLLGQLAELQDQPQRALSHYRAVSEAPPHWADAQLRIAVLLHAEDLDAARQALQQVQHSRFEQAPQAFLLEAELLGKVGDPAAARVVLDRGLNLFLDHLELLYARALLLAGAGQPLAAERDLRVIVEAHPDHAPALNALGYTLADAGLKLDEALELIERAHALQPEDSAILDSMGWVLHRLGRSAEARGWLERAHAGEADDDIVAHLGEVLVTLEERPKALRLWQERLRKQRAPSATLRDTVQRLAPELLP